MKVENKQVLNKVLIVTLTVLALGQAVWAQQAGDSNAESYFLIGNALGEGMVKLLANP